MELDPVTQTLHYFPVSVSKSGVHDLSVKVIKVKIMYQFSNSRPYTLRWIRDIIQVSLRIVSSFSLRKLQKTLFCTAATSLYFKFQIGFKHN